MNGLWRHDSRSLSLPALIHCAHIKHVPLTIHVVLWFTKHVVLWFTKHVVLLFARLKYRLAGPIQKWVSYQKLWFECCFGNSKSPYIDATLANVLKALSIDWNWPIHIWKYDELFLKRSQTCNHVEQTIEWMVNDVIVAARYRSRR